MTEIKSDGFRFAESMHVENAGECLFYHSIVLPKSGFHEGQWDLRGQFDDYIGNVKVSGKTLLDVGTGSGFLTFEAEKQGASVVSVDADGAKRINLLPFVDGPEYIDREKENRENLDPNLLAMKKSYWFAHAQLNSKAKAFYGDIYALPAELGTYDVVLIAQILVHLRDGIQALTSIAARSHDTVIIAEGMDPNEYPIAQLHGRANNPRIKYAFWQYSVGFYREILGMLGFDFVSQHSRGFSCLVDGEMKERPITTLIFKRK